MTRIRKIHIKDVSSYMEQSGLGLVDSVCFEEDSIEPTTRYTRTCFVNGTPITILESKRELYEIHTDLGTFLDSLDIPSEDMLNEIINNQEKIKTVKAKYNPPLVLAIGSREYMEDFLAQDLCDLEEEDLVGYLIKEGSEMASPYCNEDIKAKRDELKLRRTISSLKIADPDLDIDF